MPARDNRRATLRVKLRYSPENKMQSMVNSLVVLVIAQIIYGVIQMVKIWGRQGVQDQIIANHEARLKLLETADRQVEHTAKIAMLESNVNDLKHGDDIGDANMTGLMSQLGIIAQSVSKMEGQLGLVLQDWGKGGR